MKTFYFQIEFPLLVARVITGSEGYQGNNLSEISLYQIGYQHQLRDNLEQLH